MVLRIGFLRGLLNMSKTSVPLLTPEQALDNLDRCCETVPCDGPTRDVLRASVHVLAHRISLPLAKPDTASSVVEAPPVSP